ncbi:Penicillin-binding protein PbpB [Corynebacterium pseudopelargi]|uniref:Penicillin-binding protein PbpB n=2 Tax=Corynebacterium pseudopelargi TaxID=2080757 RepID=A0A3G6ITH7_9CORY|nr:Penicillin-binding protein PbpB [Corynebacterium pseudopelargi]
MDRYSNDPRGGRYPRNARSGDRPQQTGAAEHEAALRREMNTRKPKAHGQRDLLRRRLKLAVTIGVTLAVVLTARLGWVQLVWGPDLSEKASQQRTRIYVDPARRGEISDVRGQQLAYTMQARSLTASPVVLRKELRTLADFELQESKDYYDLKESERDERLDAKVKEEIERYAREIPKAIEQAGASNAEVSEKDILNKLKSDSTYQVLVRNVDPDVAEQIAKDFHGIAADMQSIRQYPNGAIAENVIGKISQDGEGQFGFEASNDGILAGVDGRKTFDVSPDGVVIPGTMRDEIPATNGAKVHLSLDLDLQTYVQQQVEQAVANSGAKSASAVVLDAKTAKVMAMANSATINPNGDIEKQLERGKTFANTTISAPFEPGSVAKVITAAGAIEDKKTTPDEVLQVPGSIDMAGVNVRDAWVHDVAPYTTTGVFGKSSNVGTLMLAERLGEQRFNDLLLKFGIGQTTGIELPSESAGLLPNLSQWSGGTFANLPIGQGMSWTLLQMAGVYQAIANDGERIEPRIVDHVEDASGAVVEQPEPEKVQVVSPATARTVRDMFRSVAQSDPSGLQQGTGPQAAIDGYQVSGKTGTAQQVDPNTGAYSNSNYWITFAGIAPADNPRYVVAIMLDQPQRGVHGEGGQSAAPLFHGIASWLLNRDNVPLSPPPEGQLVLEAR